MYVVPLPEKFDSEPLPSITALDVKSVEDRERLNVSVEVAEPPMDDGDAVIVAVGKLLSIV